MEVVNCDNCGFKIDPRVVHSKDGRVYCAKCFSLFKLMVQAPVNTEIENQKTAIGLPASEAEPTQSATKFYFCETCGKRITDRQILEGLARDKKLKGMYCQQCAVGITTMAMMPVVADEVVIDAAQKTPITAVARKMAGFRDAVPRSKPPRTEMQPARKAGIALLVVFGAVLLTGGVILSLRPGTTVKTTRSDGRAPRPIPDIVPEATQPGKNALPMHAESEPKERRNPDPDLSITMPAAMPILAPAGKAPDGPQAATLPVTETNTGAKLPDLPEIHNRVSDAELNAARSEYSKFQDDFLAELNRGDADAAAQKLTRAEQSGVLTPLKAELTENRLALRWIAEIEDAAAKGVASLAEADDVELLMTRGVPMHVGKRAPFHFIELKDGKFEVQNQGMSMTVTLTLLLPETRRKLALMGLPEDGQGLLRRAFILLLGMGSGVGAPTPASVNAVLERAGKANAPAAECAYLTRLSKVAEKRARELAAQTGWESVMKLSQSSSWKALKQALTAFQTTHATSGLFDSKKQDIADLMAKADDGIALAEGQRYDFSTSENFARFKKLFPTVVPVCIDLKYEAGKAVFQANWEKPLTYDLENATIVLQADSITLGKNWNLSLKVNMNIDSAATVGKDHQRAEVDICFMSSERKEHAWNDPRFALMVTSMYGGLIRCTLQDEFMNPGPFAGIKKNGVDQDNSLTIGKVRKPASAEGVYFVKLTMREDHFKAVVNDTDITDIDLPATAAARIQNSPLILCVSMGKWSGAPSKIYLEEFSFVNNDTPSPNKKSK